MLNLDENRERNCFNALEQAVPSRKSEDMDANGDTQRRLSTCAAPFGRLKTLSLTRKRHRKQGSPQEQSEKRHKEGNTDGPLGLCISYAKIESSNELVPKSPHKTIHFRPLGIFLILEQPHNMEKAGNERAFTIKGENHFSQD